MPDFPYDTSRMAYLLDLDGTECRYRAAVPIALLNDELGDGVGEGERQAWIHANLAHILGAVTAAETGGMIQEPWNRVLVEEL